MEGSKNRASAGSWVWFRLAGRCSTQLGVQSGPRLAHCMGMVRIVSPGDKAGVHFCVGREWAALAMARWPRDSPCTPRDGDKGTCVIENNRAYGATLAHRLPAPGPPASYRHHSEGDRAAWCPVAFLPSPQSLRVGTMPV